MDFKKNIFWIVLVVVLVAGIGGYFFLTSSIQSSDGKTTDQLASECESKVQTFEGMAKKLDDKTAPDQIINNEHVSLANQYKAKVETQIQQLQEIWKSKKLDVRFTNPPTDALAFDSWLNDQRDRISKQAAAAGLQLPADADKLMFKEPSTSETAEDVTRHRAYRLRQMAIIEEVVNVLCKKYGKQQKLKFEPEKDKPESAETVDAGAVAIERISILPSKNLINAKTPNVTTADERMKASFDEALKRAARSTASTLKGAPPSELPISYTSVDVQFVAPLATIPAISQALESSTRYTAVVTRMDFQRAANPFPSTDARLVSTTPGVGTYHNTHFQEAPVRAVVSLDLYEFDAEKEKAAAAAAAQPKVDPKAKDKKTK